jgi:hypothetical protein
MSSRSNTSSSKAKTAKQSSSCSSLTLLGTSFLLLSLASFMLLSMVNHREGFPVENSKPFRSKFATNLNQNISSHLSAGIVATQGSQVQESAQARGVDKTEVHVAPKPTLTQVVKRVSPLEPFKKPNGSIDLHFIHIPKCGGTSMTAILRQVVCQVDPVRNVDCCTNQGFCDWWAFRRCASIRGCTDHFPQRYAMSV